MTRSSTSLADGPSGDHRGGRRDEAFEAAQRDLFESVGLDARSRFLEIETPSVRTHVLEAGPSPKAGDTPTVFVHGTAAFGAFMAPLMAHLDDVPVVAFDRPGYGLSDGFAYTEANLRVTVVDALDGVLDGLEFDRVDLVGHSAGGYTSILYALANPDRVRRLTLVGGVPTFPGTRPPLPFRLMTAPGLGRLLKRLQKPGEEGVLDFAELFGEREAIQRYPALVRAIAAQQATPERAAAGTSEFEALLSVRGWREPNRLREAELSELSVPTLVVWGEGDTLGGPDDVRRGVDAIPEARLERVPAAHAPFFDLPERCAELVRRA